MINQQLIDYIKAESAKSVPPDSIKNGLIANGWKDTDITEAYHSLQTATPKTTFNKKVVWIPALIILIAIVGVFAFKTFRQPSNAILTTPETSLPSPVSTNSDSSSAEALSVPVSPTTPAATNSSTWKLYSSDFAGISFEYPNSSDIKVAGHAYSENLYAIEVTNLKLSTNYGVRTILNTKYQNTADLITNTSEDDRLSLSLFDHDLSHYSPITIGGYPAYMFKTSPSDNYTNIYLIVGTTSYQITAATLPTFPENFSWEDLEKIQESRPNLDQNAPEWTHLLSSIKFFTPKLTQQQKDMKSARQDDNLVNALFQVSANLDQYCCAAGGTYPEYIPIRAVYPSSLDELYSDKSKYGYESYVQYKSIIKYSLSPDKKHFHLGIILNAPGLTEAKKRLGDDSDFNSKASNWANGFSGSDPVFDMISTREEI